MKYTLDTRRVKINCISLLVPRAPPRIGSSRVDTGTESWSTAGPSGSLEMDTFSNQCLTDRQKDSRIVFSELEQSNIDTKVGGSIVNKGSKTGQRLLVND